MALLFEGSVQYPEDLDKFILKELRDTGHHYFCGICYQFANKSITNVKSHLESKHFPNTFQYDCTYCDKHFGTRGALHKHVSRMHK